MVVVIIMVLLFLVVILIMMLPLLMAFAAIVIVVSPDKAPRTQHGDCGKQHRQFPYRPFHVIVHARKIQGTMAQ
jgi:hypothetical protein